MKALVNIGKVVVIGAVVLFIVPWIFFTRVDPGQVAVRRSAAAGVDADDLGPGWRLRIPGYHKVIYLPSTYFFLDYTNDDTAPQEPLEIRTKDNNTVTIDVSVPVRIIPGHAHKVVETGNHIKDGGRYRYQRLAEQTAVSVLREELANLDSVGFYSTERRLEIGQKSLELLNKHLADLHLEAQAVLIRAVRFRTEYERQLGQIQLNEQNKLLDHARERVAAEQQKFDNFSQGTAALAAAREQDWIKRQAELERAYQIGVLDIVDPTPGASRARLTTLTPEQITDLRTRASKLFGLDDPSTVSDAYLIGIKNIQAETLEYKNRINAEAEAVAGRLEAEGDAMVAKVQGEYEAKLNALLNSPGGRAFVAWQAADNVTFAKELTFSSQDGIPSVLRLRRFAEQFMGTGP
ncbi:MAG TPA: SPFH domain-containing protein [Kofleriaceae bacterium]|nr:SPFH domain-containing protein [Kofleriaceae bacterium]